MYISWMMFSVKHKQNHTFRDFLERVSRGFREGRHVDPAVAPGEKVPRGFREGSEKVGMLTQQSHPSVRSTRTPQTASVAAGSTSHDGTVSRATAKGRYSCVKSACSQLEV